MSTKASGKIKEYQAEVSRLIDKLLNNGMTQAQIAEHLRLYQPEVSQLYRQSRAFRESRYKGFIDTLNALDQDYGVSEMKVKDHELDSADTTESYGGWLIKCLDELEMGTNQLVAESGVSYQVIYLILKGVTSKPQEKTRALIEKALQRMYAVKKKKFSSFKSKTEKDRNQSYFGLDFRVKSQIDETPDSIGVYVIHDMRGYPTYIGKGRIRQRLTEHREKIAFASEVAASRFSYYVTQLDDSKEGIAAADEQALFLEELMIKFVGNAVMLNKRGVVNLRES